jgi:Leucine-rich repeat (LRR) protein
MEALILDNNLIKEIPSGIGNLHRLHYFRMKENKLTTLPKELNQLPHLRYMGLEYNNITEFPPEMFDIKRDTLCNLVLDGNPVRGIPVSEEQFHKGYKMHGEEL